MKMLAKRRRMPNIRSILRKWRSDPAGAAAGEFAMILPIALFLFTGTITYGNAIYIDRKVTLTTRTVTDLVTQYSSVANTDVQTILGASAQIMAPFPSANAVVTVSEVQTDSSGNATVTWSQSLNGTKRPVGQSLTLPSTIDGANVTYIFGEVSYTYTPAIGYLVTGPITLHDNTYMAPRISPSVPCTGC
ncbi:MAG: TadE/TadG family type IV pilus assembly protein [Roseiarcus sp.]